MIFSEIYSAYYNTVARILKLITEGVRDEKEFRRVVSECAFGESALSILPSLKSGKWQLVRGDMSSPIKNPPSRPVSDLEKRWLAAVALDPRVKLFGADLSGLDGVEPLFTPDDFKVYDKYGDGDDFEDRGYIERFKTVLSAIYDKSPLVFEIINRYGKRVKISGVPLRMEYSEKDDKFRVILNGYRSLGTVNLGKVISCAPYRGDRMPSVQQDESEPLELVLTVEDSRNALERVMLHFAHFEKKAERVDDRRYRLYVKYLPEDETEMVIRVLSFGPMVKAEAPDNFVALIKDRLIRQSRCIDTHICATKHHRHSPAAKSASEGHTLTTAYKTVR